MWLTQLHVSHVQFVSYSSPWNWLCELSDQDVCEGPLVSLSCSATGKPTPSITWTRVADGAQLPVVDGNYVMSNIQRSWNGTYCCTADNGAGNPVNLTVQVRVRCKCMIVHPIFGFCWEFMWKMIIFTGNFLK